MYTVIWKKMAKGQEDLPLRPFDTIVETEAYIAGLVDLIIMNTDPKGDDLEWDKVREDFGVINGGSS